MIGKLKRAATPDVLIEQTIGKYSDYPDVRINGGVILIYPVNMEDTIHSNYSDNPDVWINGSLNDR
jgi:hypothetical protein